MIELDGTFFSACVTILINYYWKQININLDRVEFLDLSPTADFFTNEQTYDIFSAAEVSRRLIGKSWSGGYRFVSVDHRRLRTCGPAQRSSWPVSQHAARLSSTASTTSTGATTASKRSSTPSAPRSPGATCSASPQVCAHPSRLLGDISDMTK